MLEIISKYKEQNFIKRNKRKMFNNSKFVTFVTIENKQNKR